MRLTSRLINFDLVNDHLRKTEVLKEACFESLLNRRATSVEELSSPQCARRFGPAAAPRGIVGNVIENGVLQFNRTKMAV